MAKETRDVKQYKVYTLHENVVVKLGEKDGKDVTRTERRDVAHFDDKKLLDKYIMARGGKAEFSYTETWVEFEPTLERFGLPLNPSAKAEEGGKDKEPNASH